MHVTEGACQEKEKAEADQEKREQDIALGNPLLNPTKDFNVKRRWDDDVVFRNQARGTEDKRKKEFVNVCSLNQSENPGMLTFFI